MSSRRLSLSALALALLLPLGCTTVSRLFRAKREVRPEVVGAILPLSGKYEPVGKALLEGIQLGLKGSKLKLEVRDSQGEPELAVKALDELADAQKAIAVLGGVAAAEATALGNRADALGMPLLVFSKEEGITSSGSFTFRNMITVSAQAKALAKLATCDLGLRSFAVLGPEDANAQQLTTAFTEGVDEGGGKVETALAYPAEQTTFSKEVRQLSGKDKLEERADFVAKRNEINRDETDPFRRRKALERMRAALPPVINFQALFLTDSWKTVSLIAPALAVEDVITNACDAEDLRKIRATTGQQNLRSITLLGWSGWHSPETPEGVPELLARGGKFMHCAYYVDGFFPGSTRPATQKFVQAFRAAHGGRTPNLLAAYAYDSAKLYRRVLEEKAVKDPDAFRSALMDLPPHDGATGQLSVDSDREVQKPFFVLRITPEGIREVPPATGGCASERVSRRF